MKKINLWNIPEYLLLLAVLFYWLPTSNPLNWVAITLVAVLVLQIIYKNKILGIIISSLLILICCYMYLALFSELREFPTFDADAKQLFFVGVSIFTATLVVAGFMFFKYVNQFIFKEDKM